MKETILAIKLKEYRTNNNLTQSDLAEKLDVSDKTISKWELGETYPSKRNMLKLSETLGVSLETLLLEEQADGTSELELSIKYGVIIFCFIFFVTMVIFLLLKITVLF
ncbi:helix-turn-helix transcriptional regulator [Enterococcus faecium]